jgi:hypothetical protein
MGRRTASAARPTLHPFTSSAAEAFASTRTVREPFTPPFARALSASGALMPTQVADIIFSLFSLWCVCVCVCGPDDACLTTRAVRVCIPWRATVYERCRLRCSCVCTRLWSAGCEKALRLLMMTSLVGGRGSFSSFFEALDRGARVTWRLTLYSVWRESCLPQCSTQRKVNVTNSRES